MTTHRTAPPGYDATPWQTLGMSRQNWYQSGLVDYLDSYQAASQCPRLYSREDVGNLRRWLTVRRGLIALGQMPGNAPLLPPFEAARLWGFVANGHHLATCPRCEGGAVSKDDFDEPPVWCPACGVVE